MLFVVDMWCNFRSSPWDIFVEMSQQSWSWVAIQVMVGQEGLSKGDDLTRGTLAR